jgi:hypothetical protein
LRDAILVNGDMSDDWRFRDYPWQQFTRAPTQPAACQPVDDMTALQFNPAPKEWTPRMAFAASGPAQGSEIAIVLATFDRADAERLITAVHQAIPVCRSGFRGPAMNYTVVTEVSVPGWADDAVAFQASGDLVWDVTVVRKDSVILLFASYALGRGVNQVPNELIRAQLDKLARVGF